MESKSGVNYLYFGIYFALVVLMSASGVFVKESLSGSRIFFFLYSVGQAALETTLLIFLAFFLRRLKSQIPFRLFIGATFVLLILHFFDFLMERILDLSVWETIGFVLDEDFSNFLFLLDASGLSLWIWFLGFSLLALLPLAGIFFYRITEKAIKKKPMPFHREKYLLALFSIPIALLFWDFSSYRIIHPDAYTDFLHCLPWKFTCLEPRAVVLPLSHRLKKPPSEEAVSAAIENDSTILKKKPNIYLFVVESLRRDLISEETAPALTAFGKEQPSIDFTLSNANGTNLSWFSIFHSQFPYCWGHLKESNWQMGSPSLALLKKWGYKIRVYTSAQLSYYRMDRLLFGKNLLDSYQTFHHAPPLNAADADAKCLDQLQKDLAADPSLSEGQIFIVFWDATHFDYSWPKNWPPKFIPFSGEFAYFKCFYSNEEIELIKNRYRNSVHYIDSLFGNFLENLPRSDEAIVIFTGDHGEEFFEQGHLFHNSHLVQEQTLVPLYMKFGERKPEIKRRIASQIDIFPSLIDSLSGEVPSFLEGQSIFREEKRPFALFSRFNGGRNPFEFCIHNGQYKMTARFANRRDIFQSESLQIRSLRTADDKYLYREDKEIEAWVKSEFGPGLDRLFEASE